MPTKTPYICALASHRRGSLYVGGTSNLVQRVWHPGNQVVAGFSKQHGVFRLVWYEVHPTMAATILREKMIKGWQRAWKAELIETGNPKWEDSCGGLS